MASEVTASPGCSKCANAVVRWATARPPESAPTASSGRPTLGYTSLEAYYRATYVREGARLADLERALDASRTAIYGDLKRAGIQIQHQRDRRSWTWH
jgi:hypothetical protein